MHMSHCMVCIGAETPFLASQFFLDLDEELLALGFGHLEVAGDGLRGGLVLLLIVLSLIELLFNGYFLGVVMVLGRGVLDSLGEGHSFVLGKEVVKVQLFLHSNSYLNII